MLVLRERKHSPFPRHPPRKAWRRLQPWALLYPHAKRDVPDVAQHPLCQPVPPNPQIPTSLPERKWVQFEQPRHRPTIATKDSSKKIMMNLWTTASNPPPPQLLRPVRTVGPATTKPKENPKTRTKTSSLPAQLEMKILLLQKIRRRKTLKRKRSRVLHGVCVAVLVRCLTPPLLRGHSFMDLSY